MRTFAFKKIDAFASGGSSGNPAGAVYLNSPGDIAPEEMLRIARELKGFVSEVGFLSLPEEGAYDLRYYSSERAVDFCGHATVAILYDLLRTHPELLERDALYVRTPKGVLKVQNRIAQQDAVFIEAPKAVFSGRTVAAPDIAKALRTDESSIRPDCPILIVNAGLETLIVPISGLEAILSIAPDLGELRAFCIENRIDIITVFSPETASPLNDFRTRVFAPTFGYLEDPATGSGNSAFGFYLMQFLGRAGGPLTIEQNGSADHPNIVRLLLDRGDAENSAAVAFGGCAVVRISGAYHLD